MMKMQKGAYMQGIDKMILKEIPVPKAEGKQVLVKIEYVGICGSDVHYYQRISCWAMSAQVLS